MKQVKKGDTVTMDFHCAGVVSHEEFTVSKVMPDGRIVIQHDPAYEFDPVTGRCYNDNTFAGARRVLNKKHLSPC